MLSTSVLSLIIHFSNAANDQGLGLARSGALGRRQIWSGRRSSSAPGAAATRTRGRCHSGNLRRMGKKKKVTLHGAKEEGRLESGHFPKKKWMARKPHGGQTRTLPLNKKMGRTIEEGGRRKRRTRQTSSISSASSYLRRMKTKKMKKRRKDKAGIHNLPILPIPLFVNQLFTKALHLVQRGPTE